MLRTLPAESVDACVCDPPYELGFMAKDWDSGGGPGMIKPSLASSVARAGAEEIPVYRCAEGCPVALMDAQSGTSKSRKGKPRASTEPGDGYGMTHTGAEYDDAGGASRFFPTFEWSDLDYDPFLYQAKASVKDREFGCEDLPLLTGGEATDREDGSAGLNSPRAGAGRRGGRRNPHPTVKPLALMRWLVRLVTPAGGLVLDPFCGSGTTGMAALREGFRFLGCELSPEYADVATRRIRAAVD